MRPTQGPQTSGSASLERRVVELECRHVEQEAALDALSDVIATQQSQIDDLTRSVLSLSGRLLKLAEEAEPGGEVPEGGQVELGFEDW